MATSRRTTKSWTRSWPRRAGVRRARVSRDEHARPRPPRSGVSLSGLYYYVKSKEELALPDPGPELRRRARHHGGSARRGRNPVDRLDRFIENHLDYFASHMAEMKVLSHEAGALSGEYLARVNAKKRAYTRRADGHPRRGRATRTAPRTSNRRVAAYSLFGMMNWIYNWYDPLGDLDVAVLSQSMMPAVPRRIRRACRWRTRSLPHLTDGDRAPASDARSRTSPEETHGTATMTERETTTLVRLRKEGHIAVFELDDPPANTYTHEMMRQLDECILRARFDNEVHVIVLRGAGEKFFCAGANIKMLNEADPTFKYYFCLHANETLSRLEQTPKLVIAAHQRPQRRRRARDRDGGRHAHRARRTPARSGCPR